MQFDSDSIGIYVFGGVVLAGTAVSVIVDLLRKNNDRLWELATELKFRNEAADVRIKQLEHAAAQPVVVETSQPVEAQANQPQEAPAKPVHAPVEAPVVAIPEDQPGAKIILTPAPEKVEVRVAASLEEARTLRLEVPAVAPARKAIAATTEPKEERPNDRRERKAAGGMSPAVAAIAESVTARALPEEQPANEVQESPAAVPVAVLALEEVVADPPLAEAVAMLLTVPVFEPISALYTDEAQEFSLTVVVPSFSAQLATSISAEVIAAIEDQAEAFETPDLAETVALSVKLAVEAPAAAIPAGAEVPEGVESSYGPFVPEHTAALLPAVAAETVAEPLEDQPALEELVTPPMAAVVAMPAPMLGVFAPLDAEPVGIEVPVGVEITFGPFAPTNSASLIPMDAPAKIDAPAKLDEEVVVAAEAHPSHGTQSPGKKDWSRILGSTAPPPIDFSSFRTASRYTELPSGFQDVTVLREVAASGVIITGMVLAIGVESSEPSSRGIVREFVQSLVHGNDFGCQTDTDEYVLICPPDSRPSSQRKLGAIAEKLWDFQLSSTGTLDLQFSWGGYEARKVTVTEAVNAALEQMRETRIERRAARETRSAVS